MSPTETRLVYPAIRVCLQTSLKRSTQQGRSCCAVCALHKNMKTIMDGQTIDLEGQITLFV